MFLELSILNNDIHNPTSLSFNPSTIRFPCVSLRLPKLRPPKLTNTTHLALPHTRKQTRYPTYPPPCALPAAAHAKTPHHHHKFSSPPTHPLPRAISTPAAQQISTSTGPSDGPHIDLPRNQAPGHLTSTPPQRPLPKPQTL